MAKKNKPRIQILPGPLTSRVSYQVAEETLKTSEKYLEFKKQGKVAYDISEVEGRWVASIAVAAFPPSDDDSGEEAPPSENDSAPEGPPSDGPPSDDGGSDGPPSPDSDSGDKPKKDKGGKGDKGTAKIEMMLDALFQALGLPIPGADSMVPGADAGMPPGAGGPMDAAGGPPPGPPGMGGPPGGGVQGPGGQTIRHERSLKPGEAPPGATPIGSPAFASVDDGLRADHPWKGAGIVGKVASFHVSEPLGDQTMDEAISELRSIAAEAGFNVKQASKVGNEVRASLSIY